MGNTYYLYKRTSKRVSGKKYPQPVDTYIGIITPDGIIERKRQQLATTSIKVKEYGFSKAVWDSCPDDWKKAVGEGWEDKLACKSYYVKGGFSTRIHMTAAHLW